MKRIAQELRYAIGDHVTLNVKIYRMCVGHHQ